MAFANNMTLGEAIKAVRVEAAQSPNPAHGGNDREAIVYLINRTQTQLAAMYDWPRRATSATIDLTAGTAEYDVPSPFQFENIERVSVYYWSATIELEYGIEAEHTDYLSLTDVEDRRSPVRRWEYLSNTGTTDRIRFWPVPDAAQTVTIEGDGTIQRLTDDNDVLAFNGDMVALYVAAELLASQQDPMAATKRQMADELRRAFHHRQDARQVGKFYLGRQTGDARRPLRYGIDYVDD